MAVDAEDGILNLDAETRWTICISHQPFELINPMIRRDQTHYLIYSSPPFVRLKASIFFERLRAQSDLHQRFIVDSVAHQQVHTQAAGLRAEQRPICGIHERPAWAPRNR